MQITFNPLTGNFDLVNAPDKYPTITHLDCGPLPELNDTWFNKIDCGDLPRAGKERKIDLGEVV